MFSEFRGQRDVLAASLVVSEMRGQRGKSELELRGQLASLGSELRGQRGT